MPTSTTPHSTAHPPEAVGVVPPLLRGQGAVAGPLPHKRITERVQEELQQRPQLGGRAGRQKVEDGGTGGPRGACRLHQGQPTVILVS